MKEFKNKNCFITGAASGIGRSFALELAKEGMNLYITDIDMESLENVKKEVEEMGVTVFTGKCDVSKYEDFENCAKDFYSKLGNVDLLINNAGIAIAGPMEEIEFEDWKHVLGINLWSYVYSNKVFLPRMRKNGSGHVVNVASASWVFGSGDTLPYISSKFAVVGLSEALYGRLYNQGIKVSVVVPSYVRTNMFINTKIKYPKKLVSDHGLEKIEEIYSSLIKDMTKKAPRVERVVRKYIAQIKEDQLYIYDNVSTIPTLALKGEPRKYEKYLVTFHENYKDTMRSRFLEYGINMDDYI